MNQQNLERNMGKLREKAFYYFDKAEKAKTNKTYKKYFLESAKYFQKILHIDSNNVEALSNAGGALSNAGRYKEASKLLNKALKLNPRDTIALENKAVTLRKIGRYREALDYSNKILKLKPNWEHAIANKWYILEALGNFKAGFYKYLDVILKVAPDYKVYWYKAEYLERKNEFKEAIRYYGKALRTHQEECENDPKKCENTLLLYNEIGISYGNLKQYSRALRYFNKALEISPKNYVALYSKGTTLFFLKKYDSAIKNFDRILKIWPRSKKVIDDVNIIDVLAWKAECLLKIEKYKEVILILNRLIRFDKKNAKHHIKLKKILEKRLKK